MNTGETRPDDLLPLLLEICEEFFSRAGAATREEVDDLLLARHITGGTGWLIDMLGLTRLRLQDSTRDHEQRT